MVELAHAPKKALISLRELAEHNDMSFFFLQKVALDLRRAGLIESSRGKNGGYQLSILPEKISLQQIIEALEGPCIVAPCLHADQETALCSRATMCRMREGMSHINALFTNILFKTTLSDLFTTPWKNHTA